MPASSFSTVTQLRALKPRERPYEVKDEAITGGYVRVGKTGALAYVLKYRFQTAHRKMFLGRFAADTGGLAWARGQAREAMNALMIARRDGGADPVAERRAARAPARAESEPPADTLDRVVGDYLRATAPHRRDPETERILRKEILGRWAGRRLSEITSAEVRAAMREIAERAPVGANRVLGKFRRLCNWAVEHEIIAVSPVEKVRPPTPEKGRTRERVLTDAELGTVWRAAGGLGFPFGPIVKLLMLTGQRRGEVGGMRWDEVNLEAATWTIPAARAKNGLLHMVSLAPPVVELLKGLPRYARPTGAVDFVFSAGMTPPSGFSKAKLRLDAEIRKLDADFNTNFVLHDLRRTTATGMQKLGVRLEVIERCLNHISGSFSGVVGVYQRHSFTQEMRAAFEAWAEHVIALC